VDRKDAEPARVLNDTFDLFIELGASEEQADFPVIYARQRLDAPDLPGAWSRFAAFVPDHTAPHPAPKVTLTLRSKCLSPPRLRRLPGVTAVGRVFAGTIKADKNCAPDRGREKPA